MRRFLCFITIVSVLLCCTGCTREYSATVYAMDTVMDLQVWGMDGEKALEDMQQIITQAETTWSAASEESALWQNALPQQDQAVMELAIELQQRTWGCFDPRLGGAVQAWGFYDKNYTVPTQEQLESARRSGQWDLGGMLKGYTGDLCVQALQQLDVHRAILNLGGNVQTYGQKPDGTPWSIGIQNPDGGDYVGVVSVVGTMAVVTSGDYQRYFEKDGVRYHHILDPQTGVPARSGLRSVTVICRNGATADALSTALFVMGLEQATEFWRESDDFQAVFITEDGSIYATEGAALSGCEYEVIAGEN